MTSQATELKINSVKTYLIPPESLADFIYTVLCVNPRAAVSGDPKEDNDTLLDGYFDLIQLSKLILGFLSNQHTLEKPE